MVKNSSGNLFRGESEVFDKARDLVEAAQKLFPSADTDELKRTCEAALSVVIEEIDGD